MMGSQFQKEQSNVSEPNEEDAIGRKRSRLPEPSDSADLDQVDNKNNNSNKRSKESKKEILQNASNHTESTQSLDLGTTTSEPSTVMVDADTKESATVPTGNSFPERLLLTISSGEYEEAIRWSEDGKSFGIIPRPFIQTVLKQEFNGTKLESFQRKLSRWNFSRCLHDSFPPEAIVYRHDLFRQDKPELVHRLVANKKMDISAKKKEKKKKRIVTMESSAGEGGDSSVNNSVDSKSVVETDIKSSQDSSLLGCPISHYLRQHGNIGGAEGTAQQPLVRPSGILPETTSLYSTVSSSSLDQARRTLLGQIMMTGNNGGPFASTIGMPSNSVLGMLASTGPEANSQSLLARSLQEQRLADESILQRAALAAAFERDAGAISSMSSEELVLRAQQIRQQTEDRLRAQNPLALGLLPSAQLLSLQGAGPLHDNATLLELYLRQLSRRGS